ncbi:hypothetical protein [Cloacibacillus evryensis]|nr:hypothetical protein [Cloacibacillus evryensis]
MQKNTPVDGKYDKGEKIKVNQRQDSPLSQFSAGKIDEHGH